MPANRIPLNILRLKGADKKNPARIKARENEPVPKAVLGDPPNHLSKGERKCWRELVRAAPYGVIGDCDAWEVEIASCLMAEYRSDRAAITATRLNLLHSIMGRFGFTPADRSRVQIPQPKSKNPFDDD
jgi:phage terminase small subunit